METNYNFIYFFTYKVACLVFIIDNIVLYYINKILYICFKSVPVINNIKKASYDDTGTI